MKKVMVVSVLVYSALSKGAHSETFESMWKETPRWVKEISPNEPQVLAKLNSYADDYLKRLACHKEFCEKKEPSFSKRIEIIESRIDSLEEMKKYMGLFTTVEERDNKHAAGKVCFYHGSIKLGLRDVLEKWDALEGITVLLLKSLEDEKQS